MNDTGRVGELLQQGVNPNCYDWQERTPLHLAASRGYAQMVRLVMFCICYEAYILYYCCAFNG